MMLGVQGASARCRGSRRNDRDAAHLVMPVRSRVRPTTISHRSSPLSLSYRMTEMPHDTSPDRTSIVRSILDQVKREGRSALTAPDGKRVCDALGIVVPNEGVAHSANEGAGLATERGLPVVMQIVSPDI